MLGDFMSGFGVDIAALTAAAEGINTVVEQLRAHPVKDIDCPSAAVGHDRLARTLSDFCDRWQAGVQHLAGDGEQIGHLLTETAQQYQRAEAAATDALLDADAHRASTTTGFGGVATGQEVA